MFTENTKIQIYWSPYICRSLIKNIYILLYTLRVDCMFFFLFLFILNFRGEMWTSTLIFSLSHWFSHCDIHTVIIDNIKKKVTIETQMKFYKYWQKWIACIWCTMFFHVICICCGECEMLFFSNHFIFVNKFQCKSKKWLNSDLI